MYLLELVFTFPAAREPAAALVCPAPVVTALRRVRDCEQQQRPRLSKYRPFASGAVLSGVIRFATQSRRDRNLDNWATRGAGD